MKVAYLDLSPGIYEDYSLNPKRYGGGRAFAALLKQKNWFDIFADSKCFDNYASIDRASSCKTFTLEARQAAAQGIPLISLLPELINYDLIIHSHTSIYFNTEGLKAKQAVWSVGYLEQVSEKHTDLILYNDFQSPQVKNPNTRIHKFVLGKQLPPFALRQKEKFIFQCSRHNDIFSSLQVASFCRRFGIKGYFAGPIDGNYPLLQEIDNVNTFYLGQISEEHKMLLTSRAQLYTMIHTQWPTPFNLSAIEALSVGTPLAVNPIGFWPTLVHNYINGIYCVPADEYLLHAWETAPKIQQESCYITATNHSHHVMVNTLTDCFDAILA